jgi:hypothetical protein
MANNFSRKKQSIQKQIDGENTKIENAKKRISELKTELLNIEKDERQIDEFAVKLDDIFKSNDIAEKKRLLDYLADVAKNELAKNGAEAKTPKIANDENSKFAEKEKRTKDENFASEENQNLHFGEFFEEEEN